jgi:hypothetical protein
MFYIIFSISGWIVSFIPTPQDNVIIKKDQVKAESESLKARNKVYEERVTKAIQTPRAKKKCEISTLVSLWEYQQ